jgi:hypothetical protein
MKKIIKILITLITLITITSGCSDPENDGTVNTEGPPLVILTITQNYGRDIIFKEEVKIKENYTVLDVLNENVDLGTDYGGGFVSSIEGIESTFGGPSGIKEDWFYYINGICADVGAVDYELADGDEIWWDYHKWEGMNSANSSVVGMYPEPFVNGYRNKTKSVNIFYGDENIQEAKNLKDSLMDLGSNEINVLEIEKELIKNREAPTILIGQWNEIKKLDYIKDLNENYQKTGTYFFYNNTNLELMNSKYETMKIVEKKYATINSYGEGLGDKTPLWIISGNSTESIKKAVEILIKNHEVLNLSYSAAIIEDMVIELPIQ